MRSGLAYKVYEYEIHVRVESSTRLNSNRLDAISDAVADSTRTELEEYQALEDVKLGVTMRKV